MTSPFSNSYFAVKLTLKEIANPTTTRAFYLSSRVVRNSILYTPILIECNGVGSGAGQFLPTSTGGTLLINNSPGTFGFERRFSDIFERYAAVGGTAEVYSADIAHDDTSPAADFVKQYETKILGYKIDTTREEHTLTIQLAERGINQRVVNKVISDSISADVPADSVGQWLPIVIGEDVGTKAIQTLSGTTPEYSYACTLGTEFKVGGAQEYFIKDVEGLYRKLNYETLTTTTFHVSTPATPTDWTFFDLTGLVDYEESVTEIANFVDDALNGTYGIVGGYVTFFGTGDAGWTAGTGTLEFSLYENNTTNSSSNYGVPGNLISKVTINKSEYQANFRNTTATAFNIVFSFDKVCVAGSFHIAVRETTPSGADKVSFALDSTSTLNVLNIKLNDGWAPLYSGAFATDTKMGFGFVGIVPTDDTTPSSTEINGEGIGHAKFSLAQRTAPPGQINPSLDGLDMIVLVDGLIDNAGGSITGSGSAVLKTAEDAIKALDWTWTGSAWTSTGGQVDTTKFATEQNEVFATSNKYYRALCGRTEGRTTLESLYSDLCRNSACKLIRFNGSTSSKQLALYPWGTYQGSDAYVTDEEAKVLNIEQKGPDSVINRIEMQFGKKPAKGNMVDFIAAVDGEEQFVGSYDLQPGSDTTSTLLSTESKALYGVKEFADSQFEFLPYSYATDARARSARVIGEYYQSVFAKPHIYVSLEVPFYKYKTLDLMDVITLIHPAMSSYFGSSSNAKLPYYTGSGGSEVDILEGHYFKRAQPYRAQIEGRYIYLDSNGYPRIRWELRLLNNYPGDPT